MAIHAGSSCSPVLVQPGVEFVALCSLIGQSAFSVTVQDQLDSLLAFVIDAKPAVYCSDVLNPKFRSAGLIP